MKAANRSFISKRLQDVGYRIRWTADAESWIFIAFETLCIRYDTEKKYNHWKLYS